MLNLPLVFKRTNSMHPLHLRLVSALHLTSLLLYLRLINITDTSDILRNPIFTRVFSYHTATGEGGGGQAIGLPLLNFLSILLLLFPWNSSHKIKFVIWSHIRDMGHSIGHCEKCCNRCDVPGVLAVQTLFL